MNGDPAPVAAALEPVVADIDQQLFAIDVAPIQLWWPGIYTPSPTPSGDPLFEKVEDFPAWLIDEIDSRYGELFGTTQTSHRYGWWGLPRIGDMVLFNSSSDVDGMTTNLQEAGVDEADLIETDGDYLYVISGQDLVIVDARDPENLSISSRVRLTERPVGMYLAEGRLTIIGTNDGWNSSWNGSILAFQDYQPFYTSRPKTTVTVLDVADPTAPTQVQKTEMDGSLVSSRMVDGQLRIVVQQRSTHLADHLPSIMFERNFDEATQQYSYSYESRESYLERVRDTPRDSLIPHYQTLGVDGEVITREALVSLDKVLNESANRGFTSTTIATFDTLADVAGPTATKTVYTTNQATIYASKDNLYVIGYDFQNSASWNETTVWKFSFGGEERPIELAAKGNVTGGILNQFAVDEHEGYLRIVTSSFGGQSLSVLKQEGTALVIAGQVTGLAPGETVYSVRFAESRAYVVTFRMIDPLFVIDLADPTSPEVLGELKIPGFTDYLHFLDQDHLIGVGRGANESTGMFEELQISIFTVTDPQSPELLYRYSFEGGRGTTSPVTGNQWATGDGDHHAFNYFAEDGILALPVNNLNGKDGLQILRVDLATGFEPLTLIDHDTPILRTVKLDGKLVAISAGKITVHDMLDPVAVLEELEIGSHEGSLLTSLTQFSSLQVINRSSWIEGLSLSRFRSSTVSDQAFDESVLAFSEHPQTAVPSAPPAFISREKALESGVVYGTTSGDESTDEQAWDLALELSSIL